VEPQTNFFHAYWAPQQAVELTCDSNPFIFNNEDKFLSHGFPTAIASGQVNFQLTVQTRVGIPGDPLIRIKVNNIHKVFYSVTT
jgi:hypothetical protein